MSAKELNMERQNRIIQARQAMERGEVSIPDYHKMLRDLGLNPQDGMEGPEEHGGMHHKEPR